MNKVSKSNIVSKNSDVLWELIHSLNGPEKRYFKIYIQENKESNKHIYSKLYELIEKQKKEYDENAIKNKLGNGGNNFSITKSYLFELILKALEAYYSENKIDILIKKLINYSDLLRQKNLNASSFKYLQKATGISSKYERLAILVEIKHKQSLQILDSGQNEKIEAYADHLCYEESELLDLQKEIIEIKQITAKTHLLYKRFGGLTDREQKEQIQQLKNGTVLSKIHLLKTFHAKSYAYTVLGVLNSLQKNTEEAFENRFALYELYNNNNHFIEDKIQGYAGNLYNLCTSSLALNKFEIAESLIPILEVLPEKHKSAFSETNSVLTTLRALNLHLLFCVYKNEYAQVQSIAIKVETINHKYDYKILNDYIITSYLLSAMMLVLDNKTKESLHYINLILNFKVKNFRNDIQLYARFLNVATHYKLGNSDILEYELKNMQYFIGKNFLFSDIEKRAITFFNALIYEQEKLKNSTSAFFPLSTEKSNNNTVFDEMLEKIFLTLIK